MRTVRDGGQTADAFYNTACSVLSFRADSKTTLLKVQFSGTPTMQLCRHRYAMNAATGVGDMSSLAGCTTRHLRGKRARNSGSTQT
jgi:hypothetical protein